jgi:hypothetical protein
MMATNHRSLGVGRHHPQPSPPSTRGEGAQARCRHCGEVHDVDAWREFELLDQIESERLCALVTSWPDEAVIEVRRCTCGEVAARKVHLAASARTTVGDVVAE